MLYFYNSYPLLKILNNTPEKIDNVIRKRNNNLKIETNDMNFLSLYNLNK